MSIDGKIVAYSPDVEELHRLWYETFSGDVPINKELIIQNTLEDPNVIWHSVRAFCDDTGLLGMIVPKRYPHIEGLHDAAFVSLLLGKPGNCRKYVFRALVDSLIADMREHKVKDFYLFGEYNNYLTGVPKEDDAYCMDIEFCGFTGSHVYCDLYKHYSVADTSLLADSATGEVNSYRHKVLEENELELLLGFMQSEFPGRWDHEVETYITNGGSGREYVVLYKSEELKQDKIIGFCRINDKHSPSIWYNMNFTARYKNQGGVGPLGVADAYRGKGLGKVVTNIGIQELRKRGINEIIIDWTDLPQFYEKMGYRIDGRFIKMHQRILVQNNKRGLGFQSFNTAERTQK